MRRFFTSRATVDSGRPILSEIWATVHPLRRHDSIVCLSSSVMCFAMMCFLFVPPPRPGLARRALPVSPRAGDGRRGSIIQNTTGRCEAICKTKRNPPLGEGLFLHVHFGLSPYPFAEVNAPNACVYLFKPQLKYEILHCS